MRKLLCITLPIFLSLQGRSQCNATITAVGSTALCPGASVSLVASTANVYQWLENGNMIPGATNDTLVVNTPGSYTVAIDSAGCYSMSAALVVTTATLPQQPGPISGPTSVCYNQVVNYSIAPVPGATGYQWYNNGVPLGNTTSISCTGVAGLWNISVVASNSCGNSSSPVLQVANYNNPTNNGLYYIPDGNPLCPGEVEQIYIDVTHPGDIYTFYRNGSVVQSSNNQGYLVTSSGTYYCVVTNSHGCSSTSQSHTITFAAGPTTPVIVQAGFSLTTTQAYSSWTWFLNSAFVGTGQYYYPTQDGDYKVRVSNSVPCYAESAVYNVGYTAVNNLTKADELSVFPNPNTGSFSLDGLVSKEDRAAVISVIDITGKLIEKKTVELTDGRVEDLIILSGNISSGLYFLKISTENTNKVISFVKN